MKAKISVILSAFNCEVTLRDAVMSIVNQTCKDWELILCDDGSDDGTYQVALELSRKYPEKIILLRNEKNLGLNQALNRCLGQASGKYIARMDGDDISLPNRLEKEAEYLDRHPEYAIISSPMYYFDEKGIWGKGDSISDPSPADFVKGTPFCHAACMVRLSAYRKVGGYSSDPHTIRAEDYDLWFRMYQAGFRGHNLREPYYMMRDDEDAYHRREFRYCMHEAHVRFHGYRLLRLPVYSYIFALRPIFVGMLPENIYRFFHQRRIQQMRRNRFLNRKQMKSH